MTTATTTPPILPLARMARRLGVTQQWLRSEADADRVPHIRAGRKYLFAPDAVEATLAARASQREAATND